MLDDDWLYQPQEAAHVLAWSREFMRKRQAAGQQVWFGGIEGKVHAVRTAYAAAVLAEHLHDDGLAEVKLLEEGRAAISHNGGPWLEWPVSALDEAKQRENPQVPFAHAGEAPHLWAVFTPDGVEFLLHQAREYAKASSARMRHYWGVLLCPGSETCFSLK